MNDIYVKPAFSSFKLLLNSLLPSLFYSIITIFLLFYYIYLDFAFYSFPPYPPSLPTGHCLFLPVFFSFFLFFVKFPFLLLSFFSCHIVLLYFIDFFLLSILLISTSFLLFSLVSNLIYLPFLPLSL